MSRCIVKSNGAFDESASITVDGVDLGAFCTGVHIVMQPGEPVVVTLTLIDPIVEISTDAHTCYKVCANCAKELNAPPEQAKG